MSSGEEGARKGYLMTFVITYVRDFNSVAKFVSESFETAC